VSAASPATAPSAEPVAVPVATRELSKRFGSLVAVDELDLEVGAGAITALIGPNGAGKSTVINLISGAILPSSGEVLFAGNSVAGMHPREIASLGVARTFQTPRLFAGFSALENVMLGHYGADRASWTGAVLRSPGSRRKEAAARREALAWLEFAGLRAVAEEEATSLPIGTQRLVEFTRALAAESPVLLLDEPAAGLGPSETAAFGRMLTEVSSWGRAILLVEHDMGMVMSIADRVVVIDRGARIAAGTAEEVSRDPAVIEAYLGVVE
jgi:branched-chain amino acid transport system ATP-binding protein